jgi:hypothetical protein
MKRAALHITVQSICCAKIKGVDVEHERVDPPVREGDEAGFRGDGTSSGGSDTSD